MRSAHVLLQGGDPHQVQLPQAAPTSRLQSLQLHTSGIMLMVEGWSSYLLCVPIRVVSCRYHPARPVPRTAFHVRDSFLTTVLMKTVCVVVIPAIGGFLCPLELVR